MKKIWWKVPLYCLLASWLGLLAESILAGAFALETLPNGAYTINPTRWTILSCILFLAVLLLGGIRYFRKMNRKEIFLSASVMVGVNLVVGILITYVLPIGMWSFLWSACTEWTAAISEIFGEASARPEFSLQRLISDVLRWLAPYLFVLFGKSEETEKGEEPQELQDPIET